MRLLFIIWISLPFVSYATDEDQSVSQCSVASSKYGDGKSRQTIPEICFPLYKSKSSVLGRKVHGENGLEVVGYKDMIFIDDKKISVIAGKNTLLNEIIALDIDEKNNAIVILEKRGDVLTFNLNISGNVSPIRVLKSKHGIGSSNVLVDEKKEQIILLNSTAKKAYRFARLGNVFARPERRNLDLKKEISGVEMFNLKKETGEVELLDVNGNKIY